MRMRIWAVVAGALALAGATAGAETFPDTEYIAGKTGFERKVKGTLAIEADGVTLRTKDGNSLFTLPIATIKAAEASKERDEGSFGRKMALGIFASKSEEFLTVNCESPTGAEAVVFKTKKKMSPTMAAKVDFYRRQAAPTEAATATATQP